MFLTFSISTESVELTNNHSHMKSILVVPKAVAVFAEAYLSAAAVRQPQLAWLPAYAHSPTPYCVLMHPEIHHHLGQ